MPTSVDLPDTPDGKKPPESESPPRSSERIRRKSLGFQSREFLSKIYKDMSALGSGAVYLAAYTTLDGLLKGATKNKIDCAKDSLSLFQKDSARLDAFTHGLRYWLWKTAVSVTLFLTGCRLGVEKLPFAYEALVFRGKHKDLLVRLGTAPRARELMGLLLVFDVFNDMVDACQLKCRKLAGLEPGTLASFEKFDTPSARKCVTNVDKYPYWEKNRDSDPQCRLMMAVLSQVQNSYFKADSGKARFNEIRTMVFTRSGKTTYPPPKSPNPSKGSKGSPKKSPKPKAKAKAPKEQKKPAEKAAEDGTRHQDIVSPALWDVNGHGKNFVKYECPFCDKKSVFIHKKLYDSVDPTKDNRLQFGEDGMLFHRDEYPIPCPIRGNSSTYDYETRIRMRDPHEKFHEEYALPAAYAKKNKPWGKEGKAAKRKREKETRKARTKRRKEGKMTPEDEAYYARERQRRRDKKDGVNEPQNDDDDTDSASE